MSIYPTTTPSNNSTFSVSLPQNQQPNSGSSLRNRPLVQTVQTVSNKKNTNVSIAKLFLKWLTPSKNQYKHEWEKWKKAAPKEERSNRNLAILELQRCMHSQESTLDLNGLGLSSLPLLPPHIKELNLSLNKLTSLPILPEGLKELNCSYNHLTKWPDLPNTLKNFNCAMSNLVNLPNLPDNLEELNCSNNNLVNLNNIPHGLKKLDCYMNKLVHIQSLPPSLEYLYVSHNRLTEIPVLPTTLRILKCNDNNLQRLPDLPDSTITINACNNQLNELPTLPVELDWLECTGNNISTLPESITRLCQPNGRINLSTNPLSERTIQNIYAMINEVSYSGPIILFSMASQPDPKSSIRPLTKSVADWFSTERKKEITAKFSAISREENAEAFSAFLNRLQDTSSAKKDPMFKQHIAQWLTRLSISPELRATTFAVALGATESCEDRIALTWNDMQKVELIHNIESSQYDNKLPELLTAGREMFRLEQLEQLAREKASTLRFLDEIEVYLGFQTQLRLPLELPHTTKEMRFFDVSGITKSDLDTAEIKVKTAENLYFSEWFAQWSPWQKLLKRTEPMLWEAACDKRMSIYENEYHNRINSELNMNGLTGDIDAERTLGIKIMHEIDNEIFVPLTYDALANKKYGSLLSQYWKV